MRKNINSYNTNNKLYYPSLIPKIMFEPMYPTNTNNSNISYSIQKATAILTTATATNVPTYTV